MSPNLDVRKINFPSVYTKDNLIFDKCLTAKVCAVITMVEAKSARS